jgi:hypothetical protein
MIHGACDLLARPSADRGTQRHSPTVGGCGGTSQPEAGKDRVLVNVRGNLLGSALSGDVLCTRQLSPPGRSSERNQIVGDHRHSASRALLPRSIGSRINDHLADDPPAGVVRIATGDEKPREGLGDLLGVGLGSVDVEMSQRRADPATSVHGPR